MGPLGLGFPRQGLVLCIEQLSDFVHGCLLDWLSFPGACPPVLPVEAVCQCPSYTGRWTDSQWFICSSLGLLASLCPGFETLVISMPLVPCG